MRPLLLSCLLVCSCPFTSASTSSLIDLLERGAIEIKPLGLGGHSGECLRVEARNLTSAPLRTSIPPGWVFPCEEPAIQDLIVVREEVIALGPHGRTTVTCRAFCCEASNRGPGEREAFRKGHPAPKELTALASVVSKGAYDDDMVQSAVWVLSDKHDIASLGAMDGSRSDTLRNQLSRLSGQPPPRYTVRYAVNDGEMVCSGRPETITRTIHLDNSTSQHLTIIVRGHDGRILETIHEGLLIPAGGTDVPVSINVLDWPAGRYAFHVYTTEASAVHRLPFTL